MNALARQGQWGYADLASTTVGPGSAKLRKAKGAQALSCLHGRFFYVQIFILYDGACGATARLAGFLLHRLLADPRAPSPFWLPSRSRRFPKQKETRHV